MAAARRHVFVEKVLKRLFPQDPRGREKRAPLPAASETPPEKERCRRVRPLAGGGTGTPPGRRLYTVALPPEGYVPAPAPPEPEPEAPSCADSGDSEGSSSSQDVADRDPHDQPKRRRVRKHKSKNKVSRPCSVPAEEAGLEERRGLLDEGPQPPHADGPTISKNKKRKLKKKQRVKRKRAAGLLTKAAGVSFLYVPGEGDSEPGDSSEGAGGGGSDAEDPGDAGDKEGREDSVDAKQDGGEGSDGQAEGILDFLKSTQEMYFYDGVSRGSDPAFLAASEALLRGLAAGSVPPSDLRALGHMKALLLLQDPGALRRALPAFEEHCTLPPDQARVVSAFFSYWLTHVLPENRGDGPGAAPEESPPEQEA
ncbi:glutamate-rich protein 1 [Eptesicus fuscus]|uniref:glutamate-rich protein 1 n=1 Tax=Eptesicus fuscus TaxID=29078 RepID=UPI0024042DF6|nr:glutamate-rich protein 1 [Eptesicus fuscus]